MKEFNEFVQLLLDDTNKSLSTFIKERYNQLLPVSPDHFFSETRTTIYRYATDRTGAKKDKYEWLREIFPEKTPELPDAESTPPQQEAQQALKETPQHPNSESGKSNGTSNSSSEKEAKTTEAVQPRETFDLLVELDKLLIGIRQLLKKNQAYVAESKITREGSFKTGLQAILDTFQEKLKAQTADWGEKNHPGLVMMNQQIIKPMSMTHDTPLDHNTYTGISAEAADEELNANPASSEQLNSSTESHTSKLSTKEEERTNLDANTHMEKAESYADTLKKNTSTPQITEEKQEQTEGTPNEEKEEAVTPPTKEKLSAISENSSSSGGIFSAMTPIFNVFTSLTGSNPSQEGASTNQPEEGPGEDSEKELEASGEGQENPLTPTVERGPNLERNRKRRERAKKSKQKKKQEATALLQEQQQAAQESEQAKHSDSEESSLNNT